jgi:hypothetical protein
MNVLIADAEIPTAEIFGDATLRSRRSVGTGGLRKCRIERRGGRRRKFGKEKGRINVGGRRRSRPGGGAK